MKKTTLLFILLITSMFMITSCNKKDEEVNKKNYYITSATVMVRADSQSTSAGNYNDTVQSLRIMATVKDFITNDLVMEAAATDLIERMNVEKTERNINSLKGVIKGGLSLNSEEESLILTLYFSSNKKFLNETLLDEKSNIVIDNNIFVIEVINTVIEKAKEVSATTIETTDATGNTKLEYKYAFVANNIQELSWSKTYSGSRGAAKLIIICTIISFIYFYYYS